METRFLTPPVRVVHRLYGRGVTLELFPWLGTMKVRFDADVAPRTVVTREVVAEPVGMPANDERVGA